MDLHHSIAGIRAAVADERRAGRTVALVPTMGYLHEGHLSLLDRATTEADRVVVSIFVNPLQFGAGEDLDRYPRDMDRDLELARGRGAHLVFVPEGDTMYPTGRPLVSVDPGELANRLCGVHRPGHFQGVLTVVAKLFHIVAPDVAVFGRKDYQQGILITRMVADLDMPVRIVLAPLIREEDGLALSSRNALLSAVERADALALSRGLFAARAAFHAGERDAAVLEALVRNGVDATEHARLQYVEVVRPDTLDRAERAAEGDILAAAVYAGATRLIDNVEL